MSHSVRKRHATVGASTRESHGAPIDPTQSTFDLYGSEMDLEALTESAFLGQLDGNLIADGTIGAAHLEALSVLNDALADNAVAQRNLQDLSVGSAEIQALSISTDHLQAFAVTAAKILAGTITADKINAAGISANQITSGTLSVGGVAGMPTYISVFDSTGALVMQVSQTSLVVIDTANRNNAMRLSGGILSFTSNYLVGEALATWSTAISAAGIRADSILVGIAPGGHNLVPNSSFENTPYTSSITKSWPSTFAWNTSLVGTLSGTVLTAINMDTSGASLQLTSAIF